MKEDSANNISEEEADKNPTEAENGKKEDKIDVKKILMKILLENSHLQYMIILPILISASYFLGALLTSGVLIILSTIYFFSQNAQKKIYLYQNYHQTVEKKQETHTCEWLNNIIRKYFATCLPKIIEPKIAEVCATLEANKPPFIYKLSVSHFEIGKQAPRIQQVVTYSEENDKFFTMDMHISFLPDFSMRFNIEPTKPFKVKIVVSDLVFQGTIRAIFRFKPQNPKESIVKISFISKPNLEFAVKPMGAVDMLSLPKFYDWLDAQIQNEIKKRMVWPQSLKFTMGSGTPPVEDDVDRPITGLEIICASEFRCSPGFAVIEKCVGDLFPACITRDNCDFYIAYRKDPKDKPITGIALYYPDMDGPLPDNFTCLYETMTGKRASLFMGPRDAYLCYLKEDNKPPITSIAMLNSDDPSSTLPDGFTKIDITPSGEAAKLSKKPLIQLAYSGGSKSPFGYVKPRNVPSVEANNNNSNSKVDKSIKFDGLLQLCILDGVDFKGADSRESKFSIRLKSAQNKTRKEKSVGWVQNIYFKVCLTDEIQVKLFDKDAVGITDIFMGGFAFSVERLEYNTPFEDWIDLQQGSGKVLLRVTALDFGLEPAAVDPRAVFKSSKESSPSIYNSSIISYNNNVNSALRILPINHKTGVASKLYQGTVGLVGEVGINAIETGVNTLGGTVNVLYHSIPTDSSKEFARKRKELQEKVIDTTQYFSHDGYMEKLPKKIMNFKIVNQGTWKKKFFILDGRKWMYCASQKDQSDLKSFDLQGATLEFSHLPGSFQINFKGKDGMKVRAQTEAEMHVWYQKIATNINIANMASRFGKE